MNARWSEMYWACVRHGESASERAVEMEREIVIAGDVSRTGSERMTVNESEVRPRTWK